MILTAAYSVTLHLGRAFYVFISEIMVVCRVEIFPYRNTGAFAVGDVTVFYDPAFAPVRANHTVLKRSRGSPGGSSFINVKSTYGNVVSAGFGRHEAFPSYIDFRISFIGIFSLKVSINYGFVFFFILLGVPFVDRIFRHPAAFIHLSFDTVQKRRGFV